MSPFHTLLIATSLVRLHTQRPVQMNLFDSFVTINNYYLIAEFLEGGELFDRIVDKESYTECEARDCCRILFGALDYCHKKTICQLSLSVECFDRAKTFLI